MFYQDVATVVIIPARVSKLQLGKRYTFRVEFRILSAMSTVPAVAVAIVWSYHAVSQQNLLRLGAQRGSNYFSAIIARFVLRYFPFFVCFILNCLTRFGTRRARGSSASPYW